MPVKTAQTRCSAAGRANARFSSTSLPLPAPALILRLEPCPRGVAGCLCNGTSIQITERPYQIPILATSERVQVIWKLIRPPVSLLQHHHPCKGDSGARRLQDIPPWWRVDGAASYALASTHLPRVRIRGMARALLVLVLGWLACGAQGFAPCATTLARTVGKARIARSLCPLCAIAGDDPSCGSAYRFPSPELHMFSAPGCPFSDQMRGLLPRGCIALLTFLLRPHSSLRCLTQHQSCCASLSRT